MIIKCPNCESLFNLRHKATKTFTCPKCKHKAPFQEIIDFSKSLEENDNPEIKETVAQSDQATRVVINNVGEKTMLVPGLQLQVPKSASLQVTFKGVKLCELQLPKTGNYNLGRRSSDSKAQIKVAPDMTMSRVHAAMRTVKGPDGNPSYQITTIKPENPVYVNGKEIERGKICVLKSGDRIRLGETDLIFKLS